MSREFVMAKKVITGEGAVTGAGELFKGLGKKALIVTGKHVVKLEFFKELTTTLEEAGVNFTVFSGITGEPTDDMIEEGLAVYQAEACDFFIGIGGGSPLDSIKAIGVLAVLGGSISSYMGQNIVAKLPPMVAIPTTAGTGSETTKFTIITDSKKDIKMLLKGDNLVPDVAIIDAKASLTAPKSITAATGLDALTHAVESYTSKMAQPLTDGMCLSAVKRIFQYLPVAYADGSNQEACCVMPRTYLTVSGNSALAKGGTGDVLTGIIGGLVCVGMGNGEAAAFGSYLHGRAGARASEIRGKHGVLASELMDYLW